MIAEDNWMRAYLSFPPVSLANATAPNAPANRNNPSVSRSRQSLLSTSSKSRAGTSFNAANARST
jgi:hypothetical protein